MMACATKHANIPKMNAIEICSTPNARCLQDFDCVDDSEVDGNDLICVGSKDSVSPC